MGGSEEEKERSETSKERSEEKDGNARTY